MKSELYKEIEKDWSLGKKHKGGNTVELQEEIIIECPVCTRKFGFKQTPKAMATYNLTEAPLSALRMLFKASDKGELKCECCGAKLEASYYLMNRVIVTEIEPANQYKNPYQTFKKYEMGDIVPATDNLCLLVRCTENASGHDDIELVPAQFDGECFTSLLNQGRVHESLIIAWGVRTSAINKLCVLTTNK